MTRASVSRVASIGLCAALGGCGLAPEGAAGAESGGIDLTDGAGSGSGSGSSGDAPSTTTAVTSSSSTSGVDASTTGDDVASSEGTTMSVVGSSGDTTGIDEESSGTTMDCPSAEVSFDPVVPVVVLLIDQSGSMTESFGGQSRWNAVRNALIDPTTGVVKNLENDVRFGLSLYTSFDGFAGGECPVLTETAPMVANYDAIADMFGDASPESETPTGESIEAVTAALVADPDTNPKIIVLATDGEPDTCAQPNPQNGQDESIAAAGAAFMAGIRTFVIGVGNGVSAGHLQDVANAGAGWMPGDANAAYYVPSDQAALVAAFEEIIDGVRSCVLTLDTAILPGQGDEGTVTINGEEIPYEDPNGWRVNSPTEIELLGEACELIQSGDVEVVVEFTCHAILPG